MKLAEVCFQVHRRKALGQIAKAIPPVLKATGKVALLVSSRTFPSSLRNPWPNVDALSGTCMSHSVSRSTQRGRQYFGLNQEDYYTAPRLVI